MQATTPRFVVLGGPVPELEVRWRRRVSRDRWQIGAFGIACAVARSA